MVLPVKYRKSPPVIQSFDFVDIISGTGFVDFKLFNTGEGATKDHHMSTNDVFSDTVGTVAEGGTGSEGTDLPS